MDIILNFKGREYIIETKVNLQLNCNRVLKEGITQLSEKYLATENTGKGYLVIFDAKSTAGTECKRQNHMSKGKEIASFIIGIGQSEKEKIKPESLDDLPIEKKKRRGNLNEEAVLKQTANIDIDINVELPAMQTNFEELKDFMLEHNPGLQKKLQALEDSLDKIHPGSKKENMTGPMNKLGRFLKKLSEKDSEYGKLISGKRKGIEYAQKLGMAYDNVAQFIGMPQLPNFSSRILAYLRG
ncbi:MAG: hypothetical protein GY757_15650 [bacterium]|nr:hypothetical protein [bacterium]